MIFDKSSNKSKNINSQNIELIYSIFKTQSELINANENYEYAEGDMIDYYSYHIKATKSKLNHLLKSAKNKGIIIDRLQQIDLKFSKDSQVV